MWYNIRIIFYEGSFTLEKLNFILKKILFPACAIYTVISFVVLSFSSTVVEKPAITISTMALFLFMSLLISLSGLIFNVKNLALFLKTVIHMALCLFSLIFSLYFFAFFGISSDISVNKLLIGVVFCIFYLIFIAPFIVFFHNAKEKQKEKKEYTPMFKKNKDNV